MTEPLPREAFQTGRRFKVANITGTALEGMQPVPGGFQGWRRPLLPGDVLTCGGYRRGFGSDPGPDIITWTHVNGAPITEANHVEFSHKARRSMWESRPNPDYLLPLD